MAKLYDGNGGSTNVPAPTQQHPGLSPEYGMSQEAISVMHDGLILKAEEENKCKEFAALFPGTNAIESFLFFSDPHPFAEIKTEAEAGRLLEPIHRVYKHTPTTFCLCGGDWLQNKDSKAQACYKLGWIDGYMRKNFAPYVPCLGNHDTNYQGQLLDNATIRNVFFRQEGCGYYKYQAVNTLFYVLDTQIDNNKMTPYMWEEIDWFAKAIKTDDKPHSAIACHIATYYDKPQVIADNYTKIADAYNKRTAVSLNGQSYDFTGCTGTCHFVLAGHEHHDNNLLINNIPVIVTTQVKDGVDRKKWPTFDLCLADYDKKKLNMVRVGNGANRTIDIL